MHGLNSARFRIPIPEVHASSMLTNISFDGIGRNEIWGQTSWHASNILIAYAASQPHQFPESVQRIRCKDVGLKILQKLCTAEYQVVPCCEGSHSHRISAVVGLQHCDTSGVKDLH